MKILPEQTESCQYQDLSDQRLLGCYVLLLSAQTCGISILGDLLLKWPSWRPLMMFILLYILYQVQ